MTRPDSPITIGVADPDRDDADICALVSEYLTWAIAELQRNYAIVEPPADPGDVPASLAAYRVPGGRLLIARAEDGQPAGVGALRRLDDSTVEVKRMYVPPAFRAKRVGSAILDRLLVEAADGTGVRTVLLDTCRFMVDAQRLYRSRGFQERAAYAGSEIPPVIQQHWMFFEKQLEPAG